MTAHVLWYAVKTQAQADPYMNAYTNQLPKMVPEVDIRWNRDITNLYTKN